jgi:thiol-disulfide isomerase/thioredoxin
MTMFGIQKVGFLMRHALTAFSLCLSLAVQAGDISGPAPEFRLHDASGNVHQLDTLKGQVVMINFWASWCGPCRQEMPLLEAIFRKYEPLGFTLLAVNVEENSADGEAWLRDRPVSFPVLYDPDNQVSKLFDVIAMPSTVLIDRQGNVRYLHHGYKPGYEEDYMNQIRALARERG